MARRVSAPLPPRQAARALGRARLGAPPLRERRLEGRTCVAKPAERVEQVQLHRRFEEGLKVVLAVNVHQQPTEGLKDGKRSRPPVDMDTVPSRARQDAPENQLALSAL